MPEYISLMEKVFDAYTIEHINEYIASVEKNGLKEHGFPRLTANLGILISFGRKLELKDVFIKMMDLCCREIPVARLKNGGGVGNDFSVREIVCCLLELEKSGAAEKEYTQRWRRELAKINPASTYTFIAENPPKPIANWAAFVAASEQLRKYAGIGNEDEFIENQVASQLLSFDGNGMYRDPDEPMVYDSVTRLQLATCLYFGYAGKNAQKLRDCLVRSADLTLKMQSVTGEIPFGGRSNQCLFNETYFAALGEFYAGLFKAAGDIKKAAQFKQMAKKAVQSLVPWLEKEDISHVKNFYPHDSMYGCESYAYFDKYMVTAASWLYLAHVMSEEVPESAELPKGYICRTSEHFHKVFLKHGYYFAEFDTAADMHYDASGLGRVHKKGVSSALCLSVPFAKEPNYNIDAKNPTPFSICGALKTEEGYICAWDKSVEYRTVNETQTEEYVCAEFECIYNGRKIFNEKCTLSDDGAYIELSGDGALEILFPVFYFDGKNYTDITGDTKSVCAHYMGHVCRYSSESDIVDMAAIYSNRNGKYKAFKAVGKNKVRLKIELI